MKKLISFLLAIVLLFGAVSVPMTAFGAKRIKWDLFDPQLFVNDNKTDELRLYLGSYGRDIKVQVFRSETGEKGSYKRVGTIRQDGSWIDKGLKKNTHYYYALRQVKTVKGETRYSRYVKVSGWTMPTVAYANKLLKKAYRVAARWLQGSSEVIDYARGIERPLPAGVDLPGAEPGCSWDFYPVKDSRITTRKALKAYLHRYFSTDNIDELVDAFYFEFDGKLYLIAFDNPMDYQPMPEEDRVVYVTSSGSMFEFVTVRQSQDDLGIRRHAVIHSGYYDGDRFVFTDDNWGLGVYSTTH